MASQTPCACKYAHSLAPWPQENADINAGIAADLDTFELEDEWFARALPAKKFFSAEAYAQLCAMRQRGPKD
jgi:hypothetical protein